MREASNSRLLAVWWLWGDEFIGPVETLDGENVESYGGILTMNVNHFDAWDAVNPIGIGYDYTELPRGRVNYNANTRQFEVWAPSELANDERFQADIRRCYGLPQNTVFKTDEHYG